MVDLGKLDGDSISTMQQASRPSLHSFLSVPVRASTRPSTSSTGSPPPPIPRFKLKLRPTNVKGEQRTPPDDTNKETADGSTAIDQSLSRPSPLRENAPSRALPQATPVAVSAAAIASRQPGGEHWMYLRDWEAISRLVRRVDWVFDAGPGTKRRDCLIETQCFMNRIAIYPDKRYKFVRMLGDILFGEIEGPRGLGTTTKIEFEDAVIRCLVELRIVIDISDMDFFTRVRALKDVYARWALEDVLAQALAPHVQEQQQRRHQQQQ